MAAATAPPLARQDSSVPPIDEARLIFQEFDTDKNGTISREELADLAFALHEELSDEDVGRVFEALDQNGDGVIGFDEFYAWLSAERPRDDAPAFSAAVLRAKLFTRYARRKFKQLQAQVQSGDFQVNPDPTASRLELHLSVGEVDPATARGEISLSSKFAGDRNPRPEPFADDEEGVVGAVHFELREGVSDEAAGEAMGAVQAALEAGGALMPLTMMGAELEFCPPHDVDGRRCVSICVKHPDNPMDMLQSILGGADPSVLFGGGNTSAALRTSMTLADYAEGRMQLEDLAVSLDVVATSSAATIEMGQKMLAAMGNQVGRSQQQMFKQFAALALGNLTVRLRGIKEYCGLTGDENAKRFLAEFNDGAARAAGLRGMAGAAVAGVPPELIALYEQIRPVISGPAGADVWVTDLAQVSLRIRGLDIGQLLPSAQEMGVATE